MSSCMIRDCDKDAHEQQLCAGHYSEILSKVVAEQKVAESAADNCAGEEEDSYPKASYAMHSTMLLVEKFADSLVGAFNNVFTLTKSETADIFRHMAQSYSGKEDNQKSIPVLKKVVELSPDDAEAKYQLGSAYFRKEFYADAISLFEQAIILDPEKYDYHYAVGVAYEQKELFEQAMSALRKAVELNSDNPEVHYHLGMLLDLKEKHKEAAKAFEEAIKLNPKEADYHQSLGFTLESLDKHKEAVKSYKKAMFLRKPSI